MGLSGREQRGYGGCAGRARRLPGLAGILHQRYDDLAYFTRSASNGVDEAISAQLGVLPATPSASGA